MRLSLRFVVPLLLVIFLLGYGLLPLADRLMQRWYVKDLDMRAQLVASTIQETLIPIIKQGKYAQAEAAFSRITKDDRLLAMGYCDIRGKLAVRTQLFPVEISCKDVASLEPYKGTTRTLAEGDVHIAAPYLDPSDPGVGRLILVHGMGLAHKRSADTQRYILYLFVIIALAISFVTIMIAELSWRDWTNGMRKLLAMVGQGRNPEKSTAREFQPIVKDLRELVKELETSRRTRDETQLTWSPRTLKEILNRELSGDEIIVVSNREPYIHRKKEDGTIDVSVPASGLVTALEPILRACSGVWVAHGAGSADRETVDERDHVRVPPENPQYDIRRVWLTKQEEEGYYYGFSNEGLWPLCHIAHTRPTFRTQDWDEYVRVNQRFCDAVVQEAKTREPVVLVQDYHFALLPRMIREQLPRATIITFWHIPWPNPEAFGICPWREEILVGLLGSSILGFHTQFHCNNFIDSVDRFIESRIDRESHSIVYNGKVTEIRPYPISIEWPPRWLNSQKPVSACRRLKRLANKLPLDIKLGIGVDRLDYTKGIVERFLAVERLFELHPEWIGNFAFVQIAAPSRSQIESYKNLDKAVHEHADRINARFAKDGINPIILLVQHHEPREVFEYFRAAEICFVSSLHDGMNLVAKEYLAARDDEQGVLLLSSFTGAARELPEAVIVNPYNIDQCAEALNFALNMPPNEQRERMKSMRALIREYNVFRWAGRMLIDAARVRERNRFNYKVQESVGERPWSF